MTEKGKTGKTEKGTPEAAVRALAAWGPERTREAEAVCRLLPIGFPYQYPGLPLSVQKVLFLAGFLTRFTLFKLLERLRNATGAGLHRPFRPPFCPQLVLLPHFSLIFTRRAQPAARASDPAHPGGPAPRLLVHPRRAPLQLARPDGAWSRGRGAGAGGAWARGGALVVLTASGDKGGVLHVRIYSCARVTFKRSSCRVRILEVCRLRRTCLVL